MFDKEKVNNIIKELDKYCKDNEVVYMNITYTLSTVADRITNLVEGLTVQCNYDINLEHYSKEHEFIKYIEDKYKCWVSFNYVGDLIESLEDEGTTLVYATKLDEAV